MGSEPASVDIDLVSASLRADASDLRAFVEGLAVKLEDAVPARVQVERRREGMFGPKVVRRIVVEGGERRLELSSRDGLIDTACSRLSGGIVIKRETVGIDEWLATLSEALVSEARRSETTRQALERLLTQ